jgi:oxygen-independent coproporphyrinogen-3 oxidase
MGRYAARVAAGAATMEAEERLPPPAAAAEAMMLGLRTRDGACLAELTRRYGVDAAAQFGPAATRLAEWGLLERNGERLQLTRRGLLLANLVCAEFLT